MICSQLNGLPCIRGVAVITAVSPWSYMGGISSRPRLICRQPRERQSVIVLTSSPGGLPQIVHLMSNGAAVLTRTRKSSCFSHTLLNHSVVNELEYSMSHSDTQTGQILFTGTDGHTDETPPKPFGRYFALNLTSPVQTCSSVYISVMIGVSACLRHL